jgi:hypothetical protein
MKKKKRMKAWVSPPGKELSPNGVLVERRENLGWIIEAGIYVFTSQ